jgi:splicing factor U2AF subunit
MAFHLQNLYGTEQDRVNCPFFYKIGACTFGDRCARLHNKPTESQTILLANIYHTPYNQYGGNSEPLFNINDARSHLDDFYEDVFIEMEQFGEIEEIYVCRNLGDHLVGNVYCKFYDEDDAMKALEGLRGRYYGGRPVAIELSPVTDFREARCRQYDVGECNRGGFCNFMHLGEPSRETQDKLFSWQRKVQRRKRHIKKKEETEQREKERVERDRERAEREKERREAEERRGSRKSRWDKQGDASSSGDRGRDGDRDRRDDRDGDRDRDYRDRRDDRDRERDDRRREDRRRERGDDDAVERDLKRRRERDVTDDKPLPYDVALPPNFESSVKTEVNPLDADLKQEEVAIKVEAQESIVKVENDTDMEIDQRQ